MTRQYLARIAVRAAVVILALSLLLITWPVAASARDRKPPTTPSNLRVTGKTAYTVSLAWNPSSDNSGIFSYRVRHSWGYEVTVPQTQTSYTWTTNLEEGQTYSFYVYAIDGSGNRSGNSNTVTVTLSQDTTPPSVPAVSVTDVGPTHISLAWSSSDDGPYIWYTLYKDGIPLYHVTRNTGAIAYLLEPETSYVFTVKARDFGGNWSALSEPLTATTEPTNPNDTTPPTTPTNLWENHWGDLEVELNWQQSSDDFDPQWIIRYDVYVNGELSDIAVGSGRSIVYGVAGSNTISVIAVDTAGNESAPAVITVNLP